ncbi:MULTISPECIES: threonine/serine exporter family protein [Oleiagrimonas]|nr:MULTISPECIES: threonine/serine exporter family protein [Oleiagrimonas]RAP58529.1 hypothetical protein BTJ49_06270 [Oleiagrimonas sp. MCCC 1A03011]
MTGPELPAFTTTALNTRIAFVIELTRRLHQYGTAAPRLEDAVSSAALRLGLRAEVWSSPTAIILSFADQAQGDDAIAQVTQVIRMPPGDVNLARLCEVDAIADGVTEGRIDLEEGARQLRQMSKPLSRAQKLGMVFGFALSVFGFAVLMRGSWADAVTASVLGGMIGAVMLMAARHPRVALAGEALSALLAALGASLVSAWLVPLRVNVVVLSALIVLVPGMMLTAAVRELSAQHLASGVSRLFGALASMLKLIFGAMVIFAGSAWFGLKLPLPELPPLPAWVQWPALVAGTFGFALVFLASRRDWILVALSAMLGYVVAREAGAQFGPGFGVFMGGLVLGAMGNLYARFAQRPGSLVREPGIILLVPGSVGYQTLAYLAQRNVHSGTETAILLVTLLVALVAGLLFGDLLVAPRRSL